MEFNKDLVQVDIFGLSMSSTLSNSGYAIILKEISGDRRLPIIIGHFEAQAIALEMEGVKPPRPLTHDLLKNIIDASGVSVEYVTICELRDSTFFARIKFDSSIIDEIDARPSDAIALALKFGVPIYVTSEIMEEIGFIPDPEGKSPITEAKRADDESSEMQMKTDTDDSKISEKEKKLKKLKSDLEDAILKEDYEKAALIRDEIKKLEVSNLN